MGTLTIENLLKAANSSPDNDSSINLAKRQFVDDAECIEFFESTHAKLFRIDEWKKNSSVTDYELFDESGKVIDAGTISTGNFIRINLYGGGKYDWVRVVEIIEDPSEVILSVKPSHDPTQEPVDTSSTSHFFGPEATNNFCVQRNDKTVTFYVIGIAEKQNVSFTDSLIESARNAAVANVGYYSGLQKAVWKQFAMNFLRTDEEKED